MDVSKQKNQRLWIGEEKDGYWQEVVFENPPLYCDFCSTLGHDSKQCFWKNPKLKTDSGKVAPNRGTTQEERRTTNFELNSNEKGKEKISEVWRKKAEEKSLAIPVAEEGWKVVVKKHKPSARVTAETVLTEAPSSEAGNPKNKPSVLSQSTAPVYLTPFNQKKKGVSATPSQPLDQCLKIPEPSDRPKELILSSNSALNNSQLFSMKKTGESSQSSDQVLAKDVELNSIREQEKQETKKIQPLIFNLIEIRSSDQIFLNSKLQLGTRTTAQTEKAGSASPVNRTEVVTAELVEASQLVCGGKSLGPSDQVQSNGLEKVLDGSQLQVDNAEVVAEITTVKSGKVAEKLDGLCQIGKICPSDLAIEEQPHDRPARLITQGKGNRRRGSSSTEETKDSEMEKKWMPELCQDNKIQPLDCSIGFQPSDLPVLKPGQDAGLSKVGRHYGPTNPNNVKRLGNLGFEFFRNPSPVELQSAGLKNPFDRGLDQAAEFVDGPEKHRPGPKNTGRALPQQQAL